MSRRRVRKSIKPWNEEVFAENAAPNAQSKWMNSMNYNYLQAPQVPQAPQAPAGISYPVRIKAILETIQRAPVALNPQNTSSIYKEIDLYEEIVVTAKEKIKSLKDDLKYTLHANIDYGGARKTRRKGRK